MILHWGCDETLKLCQNIQHIQKKEENKEKQIKCKYEIWYSRRCFINNVLSQVFFVFIQFEIYYVVCAQKLVNHELCPLIQDIPEWDSDVVWNKKAKNKRSLQDVDTVYTCFEHENLE